MTSFTNTKWGLLPPSSGVDNNWHITDDGDTCVLHAYGFHHAVDDDSKALAKRAHACLTVCVGIPTARLEAGAAGILTYSMELKAQRDELLEALHDAATSLETIELRSFGVDSYLDSKPQMRSYAGARAGVARDVIAKVKRGAA